MRPKAPDFTLPAPSPPQTTSLCGRRSGCHSRDSAIATVKSAAGFESPECAAATSRRARLNRLTPQRRAAPARPSRAVRSHGVGGGGTNDHALIAREEQPCLASRRRVRYASSGLWCSAHSMASPPAPRQALFTQTREAINNKTTEHHRSGRALNSRVSKPNTRRIAEVGATAKLRGKSRNSTETSRCRVGLSTADEDSAKLAATIDHARRGHRTVGLESGQPIARSRDPLQNDRLDVGPAQSRLNQIDATRNAYANRAVDVQRVGLPHQERQLVAADATRDRTPVSRPSCSISSVRSTPSAATTA